MDKIKIWAHIIMDKIETWIARIVGDTGVGMTPPKSLLYERFVVTYDNLLEEEENMKNLVTRYGTGDDDVELTDIDKSMDAMKQHIIDIRKIAKDMTKEQTKL